MASLRDYPSLPIPRLMPGLVCWYSPFDPNNDGTQLANNTAMSAWSNKNANTIDMAQATGASQPTYKTSAFNGKPLVSFSGSNFMLAQAASPTWANFATNFTIYVIFSLSSSSNVNQAIISKGNSTAAPNWLLAVNRTGSATNKIGFFNGSVWIDSTSTISNTADLNIAAFSWNGISPLFFVNNSNVGTSGIMVNVTSNTQSIVLGGQGAVGTTNLFHGNIGDILIYSSAHTSSQIQQVQTFFSNFYGMNF